ncbi:Rieske (2Fe-2S) protein [Kocuria sp. M1N1S27]|uniref:Rieske (2Fe-2S) protein n=1 Tax=Kocuria kalidii TaxID=3376283 RepID=UPI00379A5EF3
MTDGPAGTGPVGAGPARAGTAGAREHLLGPLEQIPPGEGRAFAVDGEQIAVFRLRDDTLRALSAICSHRGGPVTDGQIDHRVVVCPLHQHTFALDTGCSTTGQDPLRSYRVSTDAQRNIVLHTG